MTMDYFTDEKIKQLLDDEEVVKRLIDFVSMDGAATLRRSVPTSPQKTWKRIWKKIRMNGFILKKNRTACHMTNRPSSGSSSK